MTQNGKQKFRKNILDWDHKNSEYPVGTFEFITASTPCTEFSTAKTTGPRNLEAADRLVLCALEIIRYFKPRCWWF